MTTIERTDRNAGPVEDIAVTIVDTDVHPDAGVRGRAEVLRSQALGGQDLALGQRRHPHPALLRHPGLVQDHVVAGGRVSARRWHGRK
jgi:hypothetical protein